MMRTVALGLGFLGLAVWLAAASAQTTPAPVPVVPPLPPIHALDFSTPSAPILGDLWKTDGAGRDYHFYADVGLSYMWIHGGNPLPNGPAMGPNFSAGVLNDRGAGLGVSGSELYQSTTRTWEGPVLHKP